MDVTSEDEFLRVCVSYNGKWEIYAGYNEHAAGSRGSKGVIALNNTVIDIDPPKEARLHPSGTIEAIHAAERLASFFYHNNIHEHPVVGCSGNGAYVWLSLPPRLLGNEESRIRLRGGFQKFATFVREQVEAMGSRVKFDSQCTTDFARIIRCVGTTNLKGLREPAPNELKQLDDFWCRNGFWTTRPDRIESEKFWPFLDSLEVNYAGRQEKAAWVLPAPPPDVLNWLYYGCPRMRGLAGVGEGGIGAPDELSDYALWLYFGVNLIKVAGSIGGEEWERVSKLVDGYNPDDWDASNPVNKISEALRFSGPPRCSLLKCPIAGNPKCPKSPAGWAARHPSALRIVGGRVDDPVYADFQAMDELHFAYYTMAGMSGDQFSHEMAQKYRDMSREARSNDYRSAANEQIE